MARKPKDKRPAPKTADGRKDSFANFTRAELIKTIRSLDRRQTKLLNQVDAGKKRVMQMEERIAQLEQVERDAKALVAALEGGRLPPDDGVQRFPWET